MGKISDALEKSLKEKELSGSERDEDKAFLEEDVLDPIDARLKKSMPENEAGSFSEEPPPAESFQYPADEELDQETVYKYSHDSIDENLITFHRPQTVEAEQFRILKTKIMFPEKGDPSRTIMITSTFPGEGKSFVAANLAISMAQNIDEYVLLMDCDMRLPTIHSLFGFGEIPGLSSYLSGNSPLSTLLVKTAVDKLTILPGGKPPKNPSELLSSGRMANLLTEVRSRYKDRYIVIDTPPPQLTAEAGALAKLIDGIILVVKYGATNREYVKELVDMFGTEKIIGIVFNQFDVKASVGYGYGYGEYGAYGGYYGQPVNEE